MKFGLHSNFEFALIRIPWLLFNRYLTVHKQKLNFDLEEVNMDDIIMWVQLSKLPMQLYDKKF